MKRRWRPSGDCNSGYLKHMLPVGAAGGQLSAGIAAEIYIYIKRYFYSRIPSLVLRALIFESNCVIETGLVSFTWRSTRLIFSMESGA